jgi:hypothetical protein
VIISFTALLALFEVIRNIVALGQISQYYDLRNQRESLLSNVPTSVRTSSIPHCDNNNNNRTHFTTYNNNKTIIAYAISITQYSPSERLLDRAAVLHQSIKLAAQKSPSYGYHMYAFVHPEAKDYVPMLTNLGYRVQIRETPFNKSEIVNEDLIIAQGNGCCGDRVRTVHCWTDTQVKRNGRELFFHVVSQSYSLLAAARQRNT